MAISKTIDHQTNRASLVANRCGRCFAPCAFVMDNPSGVWTKCEKQKDVFHTLPHTVVHNKPHTSTTSLVKRARGRIFILFFENIKTMCHRFAHANVKTPFFQRHAFASDDVIYGHAAAEAYASARSYSVNHYSDELKNR